MHLSTGIVVLVFSQCFLLANALLPGFVKHHDDNVTDSNSTAFPNPLDDPFYKAPQNIDTYRLGQVIRSRAVNTTIKPDKAQSSYQILYRTSDTFNKSEATVATIWKPFNPRNPPQIFSYHSYMDSDSADCAPSYAWLNVTKSKAKVVVATDAVVYVEWALGNGIYVINPDDEGPKAAFIAGFQSGHAALDGIRGTRNFFKLPGNTGAAVFGYSGGAAVAAWAANLAQTYAPDVNMIGACHGGTPIDLKNTFTSLNGKLFSGSAGAGLVGLMQEYPELNKYVLDHADDHLLGVIKEYRSRGQCLHQAMYGHIFADFFSHMNVTNFVDQPIPSAVLARETLLMDRSSVGVNVPTFPRLLWHARGDEIAPFEDEQKFVQQQCRKGANVQFQVFPLTEHTSAGKAGIAGSINFLNQVFNMSTPKITCGSSAPYFPTLHSVAAINLIGLGAVNSLLGVMGTTILGEDIEIPLPDYF